MHDTNSSTHSNEHQLQYTSIKLWKSTVSYKLHEKKSQKSSGIIGQYVTQNKWYRFRNQNSHASYEYLYDEQVVLMIAGISDLIKIDVSSEFLLTKTYHTEIQSSAILFNITWINKSVNRYISGFLSSSSINSSNAVCMIMMYCLTYFIRSFYVSSKTNKYSCCLLVAIPSSHMKRSPSILWDKIEKLEKMKSTFQHNNNIQ